MAGRRIYFPKKIRDSGGSDQQGSEAALDRSPSLYVGQSRPGLAGVYVYPRGVACRVYVLVKWVGRCFRYISADVKDYSRFLFFFCAVSASSFFLSCFDFFVLEIVFFFAMGNYLLMFLFVSS